jgi:hypothetical protein
MTSIALTTHSAHIFALVTENAVRSRLFFQCLFAVKRITGAGTDIERRYDLEHFPTATNRNA